jgi:hypothetical protein
VYFEVEVRWVALATWLWDDGRDDETAVVRAYWPTLRDNRTVFGVSLHETLRPVARHSVLLGRRAREIEEGAACPMSDAEWN